MARYDPYEFETHYDREERLANEARIADEQKKLDKMMEDFLGTAKLDDKQAISERDRIATEIARQRYVIQDLRDPVNAIEFDSHRNEGSLKNLNHPKKNDLWEMWNPAREQFVTEDNQRKLDEFNKQQQIDNQRAIEQAQREAEEKKAQLAKQAEEAKAAALKRAEQEKAELARLAELEKTKKFNEFNEASLDVKRGQARNEDRSKTGGMATWLGLIGQENVSAQDVAQKASEVGRSQSKSIMDVSKNKEDVINKNTNKQSVFEDKRKSLLGQKAGAKR